MTTQHDELHRMASEDPTFTGAPDLVSIRRSGRRLRTRRRIVTGAATLAVVGAIAIPIGLTASGAPETSSPGPATSGREAPADPGGIAGPHTLPTGCGALGCPDDAVPETGEVVGEPWKVGEMADGTEELIYAVRPAPDIRFLATGLRDDDGLDLLAYVLRPGRQPGPGPLWVSGGVRRQGPDGATYTVVGMVEGEHATVGWRSAPGAFHAIDVNHDLAPGYTVFWFIDDWDPAWPTDDTPPVDIRVDDQEYTPSVF